MIIPITVALCALVGLGLATWYIKKLFKGPDYLELPVYYPFKSKKTERQYHRYYDERSKEWPTPSETRYIEGSYGKTFVRICGRENAPPLVLLPSGFASSLIWLPNIQGLAPHFRIYAVDNIYDVGRSVNTRPVVDGRDLTEWLDALFTELELGDNISLLGLSFGGWLASQYAICHQDRLHGVVLAAPVATVLPLPGEWAWRGIMGALSPHKFFMTHFLTNWMCQDLAKKGDEFSKRMLANWMNDALMAMKCFTFRMPITPTVLTDEEFQSLRIPVLFLVGENEVVYPADRAVHRINAVAPSIITEVILNASHDLTISQTQIVNSRVTSFLLGTEADVFSGQ
ncbi:MAG: alpha/beta hydrolase [Candidatus Fermentibacteraceae bacterium]|nr:alpha/beta hydrolase [Candidatus Fermentibacteraceae bacterium]MBN2609385.1 alpha/beta hydrolase [Candidatus Fermentibacteraceae bacterium]